MCPLFCVVVQVHSVDEGRPQGRGTKQKGCAASITGGQGAKRRSVYKPVRRSFLPLLQYAHATDGVGVQIIFSFFLFSFVYIFMSV